MCNANVRNDLKGELFVDSCWGCVKIWDVSGYGSFCSAGGSSKMSAKLCVCLLDEGSYLYILSFSDCVSFCLPSKANMEKRSLFSSY